MAGWRTPVLSLTTEPERVSSGKKDSLVSLHEPPDEAFQWAARSKDFQWENKRTEAQGKQEEQESRALTEEVPGYGNENKLIVAVSVIVVAMIFFVIFCRIAICHRTSSKEGV